MTEVVLFCNSDGAIKKLTAKGHAGFAEKGKDIVCASVTELLRTALKVLENTQGLLVKADLASRGNLAFSVEESDTFSKRERLICTADFIRMGIKDLEDEYPEYVHLREVTE